jgi:hypothetical protein
LHSTPHAADRPIGNLLAILIDPERMAGSAALGLWPRGDLLSAPG